MCDDERKLAEMGWFVGELSYATHEEGLFVGGLVTHETKAPKYFMFEVKDRSGDWRPYVAENLLPYAARW
jgi:hypothetical protein